jgi:hypothetical protein
MLKNRYRLEPRRKARTSPRYWRRKVRFVHRLLVDDPGMRFQGRTCPLHAVYAIFECPEYRSRTLRDRGNQAAHEATPDELGHAILDGTLNRVEEDYLIHIFGMLYGYAPRPDPDLVQ